MMILAFNRWMSARFARRLRPGALGVRMGLVLALAFGLSASNPASQSQASPQDKGTETPDEAPTGFNNSTNGFEDQNAFDKDRSTFEEVENITPDGLGPVYNATSCVSCHQNPVSGSSSQVSELRPGHLEPDPDRPQRLIFVEAPGGSLIHQRAIDAAAQEHVPLDENEAPDRRVRTLRISTNTLGNGFVEVIPDEVILNIRRAQPAGLKGLPVVVPVVVRGRIGPDGGFTFALQCQVRPVAHQVPETSSDRARASRSRLMRHGANADKERVDRAAGPRLAP
jgi:hypothetical protein